MNSYFAMTEEKLAAALSYMVTHSTNIHTHPRPLADFSISQHSVLKKSNTLKTNKSTSSEHIPSKLLNLASNAIVSYLINLFQ